MVQWSSRGCDFRKQCGASKVRKQSRSRNHPPYTFRSKFCRGWYDRVERRPFRESQQIETDAFDARRGSSRAPLSETASGSSSLDCKPTSFGAPIITPFPSSFLTGWGTSPRFRLCCSLSSAWVDHINSRPIASRSLTIGSGACRVCA